MKFIVDHVYPDSMKSKVGNIPFGMAIKTYLCDLVTTGTNW